MKRAAESDHVEEESEQSISDISEDDEPLVPLRSHAHKSLVPGLHLKADHMDRPIYVTVNKRVYLEAWGSWFAQSSDFLVAIADPVQRLDLMHEYLITETSLYGAFSIGLDSKSIISTLARLSKHTLPEQVKSFVINVSERFGRVSLVLRQGKLYCESKERRVLESLLEISSIGAARVPQTGETIVDRVGSDNGGPTHQACGESKAGLLMTRQVTSKHSDTFLLELTNVGRSIEDMSSYEDENAPSNDSDSCSLFSFEVFPAESETVRREAKSAGYPLIEEFDFKSYTSAQKLSICLKPSTKVRPYQEKSLGRMFGNGSARSGVIVLPCGAGKTLVGCCCVSTIQQSTIVLCTSAVAVAQWRECFRTFTTVAESDIVCFTSAEKKVPVDHSRKSRAQIFITTYSMMATTRRSDVSEAVMKDIQKREWGLMLLDEVHVVPANTFRRVLCLCKAHCKLGLTATLVREDGLIADLSYMIGPKIYEANWSELTSQGYLARVKCEEVRCSMTAEFYCEYLRNEDARKRRRLCVMNPCKLKAAEALKVEHVRRGDKIILFSDDVLGEYYGWR